MVKAHEENPVRPDTGRALEQELEFLKQMLQGHDPEDIDAMLYAHLQFKAAQLVYMVYWEKHFRRIGMKQLLSILIAVIVLSTVGCAMIDKRSNSYALPKHKVYIHCNGKVMLKNGQIIYFNSAVFTANTEMVRIESTMVHQTILWSNIYKVEIINAEMQRQEEDSVTGRKERDWKEYPGESTGPAGSDIDEVPSTQSG